MKYLVNILSFEDLKAKYRELAKELHPDCGGNKEAMQELNNEYDQLFPVWKNRSEVKTNETADSDRVWFYTQNGWAGENYRSGRSTKEIAEIIRTYLKEIYSDCKWSVRYESFSGGSAIHCVRIVPECRQRTVKSVPFFIRRIEAGRLEVARQ